MRIACECVRMRVRHAHAYECVRMRVSVCACGWALCGCACVWACAHCAHARGMRSVHGCACGCVCMRVRACVWMLCAWMRERMMGTRRRVERLCVGMWALIAGGGAHGYVCM